MKKGYRLLDFLWIVYPVIVTVIIYLGVNFLMTSGLDSLSGLTVDQAQVEMDKKRAEDLEKKLEILKTVSIEGTKDQMNTLLGAMPASRQVWLLINELKVIGLRSGMPLESYKGSVGDVQEASESAEAATESAKTTESAVMTLDVEYQVGDIRTLANALGISEKLLPLVKILSIEYVKNSASVKIEGAWSGWPPVNKNPESALAYDKDRILDTISKLEGYEIPDFELTATAAAEPITATSSGLPED